MTANTKGVNPKVIEDILEKDKAKIALSLKACAHCSMCAESCFLFQARNKDPKYMPSYKFLSSLGVIYKKKGKVDRVTLEGMRETVWKRCVLCTRCYCPMGIDIPYLIRLTRRICRSQGVYHTYDTEA
jgi:Fe-S oxidoreductase